MKNIKHTPGQWKITYSGDGKVALINKGNVATVELDDNINGERNTSLIAAAPDLLDSAIRVCNEFTYSGEIPKSLATALNDLQVAINKANGL